MKPVKRFLSVLLACAMLFCFTACGSENTSRLVKYNLPSDPVNLDPPLAEDPQSALVVTNLFEGLLRLADDGKLTEGVAFDYDVSGDGLEYLFYLREDAAWNDGTPLTADDFVFGFRRLMDPATGSSSASKFYCIKNGKAVHKGEMSVSSLGVVAVDDHTLSISLDYPNTLFLTLLTTPAAMPCNEDFFTEAKGRYGLSADTILSNGAYRLKDWERGEYLALRKNDAYHSADQVKNGGVSLFIKKDISVTLEEFLNEKVDGIYLEGEAADQLSGKGFNSDRNSNSVWGILLNRSAPIMANDDLANALLYGLDRSTYEERRLPNYLALSDAIVPPAISVLEKTYRSELAEGVSAPGYDKERAISLAQSAFSQLGIANLTELTVIVPEDTPFAALFSYVSQVWQRDLNVYFKVEVLGKGEYESRLSSGSYDCAIVRYSGSYNSPEAFLSQFGEHPSYGEPVDGIEQLLYKASQSDLDQSVSFYCQAEQKILESAVFLPLAYQTDVFVSSASVNGFVHDISGQIVDFKNCIFS